MRNVLGLLMVAAPWVMAADSAVIVNSGSTNTPGFRIEITPAGEATFTPKPRRPGQPSQYETQRVTRQVPPALVKRFFASLDAGKPLSSLPHQRCMKSASFGFTLVVESGDEQTPDLSCGNQQDSRTRALATSASDIVTLFTRD